MRSSSVAAVQILKVTSPGSDKNSFVSDQAEDMLAVVCRQPGPVIIV